MSNAGSIRRGQTRAGWLFVLPTLVVLGLFLAVPVVMALWVSFTDWNGRGSPFASGVGFVGGDNYRELFGELPSDTLRADGRPTVAWSDHRVLRRS